MMNCGVILPEPGYLQGLKDLCHAHGAYLAFDEVKTGATLAYGGATEAFGVTPDIVCLAKAIGGGTPCGAIGATRGAVPPGARRRVRHGRHVQRQSAHDGGLAARARSRSSRPMPTRGSTRIDKAMKDGLRGGDREVPAACLRHRGGREGVGDLPRDAGARVPRRDRHRRAHHATSRGSFQQNRGVFKSPWTKQETWTLSVCAHRGRRRALHRELRGVRLRTHGR